MGLQQRREDKLKSVFLPSHYLQLLILSQVVTQQFRLVVQVSKSKNRAGN